MSASMRGAVCYVLVFIFPILYATNDPTLNDVLTALEKMVSFYKVTHTEMNLDGIYGLRVLEGQILLLLMEYEKGRHQHLPLSVVARLHMLHQRARNVSERSLPFLANQDKAYYNKLRPLVEKPFMVAHEYRRVDLTLRWIQTEKQRREVPFDEDFSDRCMAELMGTGRGDGRTCILSAQCLGAMFIRGTGEYQITHQLIYMMLAEQEGCVAELNQWLRSHGWPGGMQQLYLEFCSNNLLEMQQQMLALDGTVIPIYQDLFMEQQFVCPVLGFMEFLHAEWLKQILYWQKPNGCFGRMPVTDFARTYKDMHGLDYQYEDDKPGQMSQAEGGLDNQQPPPKQQDAQDMHQAREQYRLNERNRNTADLVSAPAAYVDKESAVIQQSNKLRLVGAGKNNTLNTAGKSSPGGVQSVRTERRQIVKRTALGAALERRNYHSKENTKNDKSNRIQRQKRPSTKKLNNILQGQYQNSDEGKGVKIQQDYFQKTAKETRNTPADLEGFANNQAMAGDDPEANQRKNNWSVLNNEDEPQANGQQQMGEFMIRRLHYLKQPEVPSYHWMVRKLLFERDLAGNCLSHKTAVAAGALSQYLRFLINPGNPEFQSHYRIDGPNVILNPSSILKTLVARKTGILVNTGQKVNAGVPHAGHVQGHGEGHGQPHGETGKRNAAPRRQKSAKSVKNQKMAAAKTPRRRPDVEQRHVVPRPHPDDMIHSEVNENQGDEDNHPQDYYDPDDDRDDPDAYEVEPRNDLPKLSLSVNHRFRHNTLVDSFDRRGENTKGDEEYEQYVDDEDDQQDTNNDHRRVQKLDLLNPRRAGEQAAPRRVVINVPAGETAREAHHDEDTYSYYDKDDAVEPAPRTHRRVKLAAPHVHYPRRTPRPPARRDRTGPALVEPVGEKLPHPGGVSPPGKIYMVLFSVMIALLIFMYRFVKKRRIVIRYPRNGFR